MEHSAEIVSYGLICIPSFMKISIGLQAILSFCLRNLRKDVVIIREEIEQIAIIIRK